MPASNLTLRKFMNDMSGSAAGTLASGGSVSSATNTHKNGTMPPGANGPHPAHRLTKRIRPFVPEDISQVAELHKKVFPNSPLFRCGAPKLLPTAFLRESVARRRSSFTGLPGKPWKDPWVLWRVASADAYARAPDPGGRLQPVHGGSLRQESSGSR